MSKIRMETDNLFPFPKGAYIGNKRSGAVYINVSNEYVPPGEKVKEPGSRGYTGHEKKCELCGEKSYRYFETIPSGYQL